MKKNERYENELDRELKDHLERQIADYIAAGMSPDEARRKARLLFGTTDQVKDDCREIHYWRGFEMLFQDLRYTLRALRKSPAFTAVAVLVLAIGIGSNLTVFSLIDSLFLRPLPVDRPDEVVQITSVGKDGQVAGIPSRVLEQLRNESVLSGVCGFLTPSLTTEINGAMQSTGSLAMTGDCVQTLGLRTQIGHPFSTSEDKFGAENVVLLSDSLWHSAFAGSNDVLGKKIQIEGAVFTIIGVTDRQFTGFLAGFPPGLIIPLIQMPSDPPQTASRPIYFWVNIYARRAPGVSTQQVQTRISVIEKQLLEQSVPGRFNDAQRQDYFARKIAIAPSGNGIDRILRARFGKPLYAVLGICASVLLIGCANLTSLLLARGLVRQREIIVRLALGAKKWSVIRLLALESTVLVLAGSVVGVLFAYWAGYLIIAQAGAVFTGLNFNLAPDLNTVGFLIGIVVLVAIVLAAVAAWQTSRLGRHISLSDSGRGIIGSSTRNQKILLALQVAFTLTLVSGSSFFTSSMKSLYDINLGMKTHGLSEAILSPIPGQTANQPTDNYHRDLLRQIESLPDVSSVSIADYAPLWTRGYQDTVSSVEDSQTGNDIRALPIAVTERFFETIGIPIIAGEGFRPADRDSTEFTTIVSRSLAKQLGGDRVIGQHIRLGNSAAYQQLKVVGIADDALFTLANPQDTKPPTVYVNRWQHPDKQWYSVLLVRTVSGTPFSATVLRQTLQPGGREFIQNHRTLDDEKDQALVEDRMLAYLSIAFGVLALALAATGLFGLLSYLVASRTGEIGIRMALGAVPSQIRWLVMGQLLFVMAAGVIGGLALTLIVGRVFSGLFYGVNVTDPRLLGISIAVLVITAFVAAWIPARRASLVDPLVALRHE